MSKIRVDSLVDRNGTGAPTLTQGINVTGQTTLNGSTSIAGVATFVQINATSVNSTGIITATSFVGDGSALTGLPNVTSGQVVALQIVLDPLPFRS